jgi:hypothetical protein
MTKSSPILAILAGFAGGFVSHYISHDPLRAQAQVPAPSAIRARNFSVVDDRGHVLGTFAIERIGGEPRPVIRLFDERGAETWHAGFCEPHAYKGK